VIEKVVRPFFDGPIKNLTGLIGAFCITNMLFPISYESAALIYACSVFVWSILDRV
jgi:hypothetical protein